MRWIVPHAAGGGHDTYARLIAPSWEKALGVDVVVQNENGAGGRVGVKRIRDAPPDGLTLGLVNGTGLMASALVDPENSPNLLDDLTPLARVAPMRHVWLCGTNSSLASIDDLLQAGEHRPVVFAIRDVGAPNLVDSVGTAHLLGLEYALVAGYGGSASRLLALQRGEVDVVTLSLEAARVAIDSGRVRPVLQLDDGSMGEQPFLRGVPWFGGEDGLVHKLAQRRGANLDAAAAKARSLLDLMSSGRLVVAPPGLDPELRQCLEKELAEVLNDPDLRLRAARAGLSWEPTEASAVRRHLETSFDEAAWLVPMMRQAVRDMRE